MRLLRRIPKARKIAIQATVLDFLGCKQSLRRHVKAGRRNNSFCPAHVAHPPCLATLCYYASYPIFDYRLEITTTVRVRYFPTLKIMLKSAKRLIGALALSDRSLARALRRARSHFLPLFWQVTCLDQLCSLDEYASAAFDDF